MAVIVNGIPRDIIYQRCTRCISDSTCPGIRFDAKGVCNFCHLHDKWVQGGIPTGQRSRKVKLRCPHRHTIKKDGKGKKYDCVVGISGGSATARGCCTAP
jgi:hypothetical protein